MKLISAFTSGALVTLISIQSFAQDDVAVDADAEGVAEADVEERYEANYATQTTVAPREETAPVTATRAEVIDAGSDHDQMVGRLAVGYLGRQTMTVGATRTAVVAPVIGVRYWLDEAFGIDLGIGFNHSGGSTRVVDDASDTNEREGKIPLTAVILHAGVPLNLADAGHFSFQVVPELNIGYASTGNQSDVDGVVQRDVGFHMSAGARAGGEVHFGFMGIPQLSLQGSVGLYFQHETGTTRTRVDTPENVTKGKDSSNSFGTTLGADPWDIFTSNISALYYF